MGLLDDLLDARLVEAFDEHKIRRGYHGRFADKPNIPKPENSPGGAAYAPGASPLDVARGGSRKRKLSEDELARRVGTGPWSKGAATVARQLIAGKAKDTESAHRGDGHYSAERTRLHERIADLLLRHAHEHPGEARALFMAGGAASGKSSAIDSGQVDEPPDTVVVNPDVVRKMLPEYQAMVAAGDESAAAKTHEEASHIAKLVMNIALSRHHHVMIDGVGGGNPGKFAGKVSAAVAMGHRVEVNYVSISIAEAEARAKKRAARSGRHVPLATLRNGHAESSARFREIDALEAVTVRVFDNNGASPQLVAERRAGERKLRVMNEKAYREFLAKARRDVGQE